MTEMIPIDKSSIPADKLSDALLLKAEADLRQSLGNSMIRTETSVHEAGHIIYARRAGYSGLIYRGAAIEYAPERVGDNDGFGAFYRIGASVDWEVPNPDAGCREIARMCAAGEVALRVLTAGVTRYRARQYDGDFDWFRIWAKDYFDATEEEILQEWEAAKQDVERDLRSHAFRQEIWAVAREFEQNVFGVPSLK